MHPDSSHVDRPFRSWLPATIPAASMRRRMRLTLPITASLLFGFHATPTLAQSAADEPPAEQGNGFLQIIFSGGPIGILIILLLLALSLTAAYLIFDHLINLRRKDIIPEGLGDQVRNSL